MIVADIWKEFFIDLRLILRNVHLAPPLARVLILTQGDDVAIASDVLVPDLIMDINCRDSE